MEDLDGKVAVITGGAGGIGYAMAESFAGVGAKLMLADIAGDELDAAVDRLSSAGATVAGTVTDVSDPDQVDALRDATLSRYGSVHVVCNNAGVGGGGSSWTIPAEHWRWVLGIDLFGVIHGVSSFVPLFVEQGEGHVVNTASIAGLLSPAFMGPYNVAKHGVVTLSETLFAELAMTAPGVGVSVLCPGWVNTRIYDVARYGTASGAAAVDSEEGTKNLEALTDVVKNLVAGGSDPSVIGTQVVDAVQTRRFYILPHPDFIPQVADRTARTVEGRDPTAEMLNANGAQPVAG